MFDSPGTTRPYKRDVAKRKVAVCESPVFCAISRVLLWVLRPFI